MIAGFDLSLAVAIILAFRVDGPPWVSLMMPIPVFVLIIILAGRSSGGAPLHHPDDARRAIQAALEMQTAVEAAQPALVGGWETHHSNFDFGQHPGKGGRTLFPD